MESRYKVFLGAVDEITDELVTYQEKIVMFGRMRSGSGDSLIFEKENAQFFLIIAKIVNSPVVNGERGIVI